MLTLSGIFVARIFFLNPFFLLFYALVLFGSVLFGSAKMLLFIFVVYFDDGWRARGKWCQISRNIREEEREGGLDRE